MLDEPIADLATPALTTLEFPADELGRVAASMLVERITHGRTTPEQILLPPELTVRGTTAPPARL